MAGWLFLLVLGPAQTIAGKYVPLEPVPVPAHLPADVGALCVLVERGHATAEVYGALGAALLRRGDKALAYRAFHKAHRLRPGDSAWGARMMERKAECAFVEERVIRAEEREAAAWVKALAGFDGDLETFYERYGRPEDNLWEFTRRRRFSGVGGFAGLLVGGGFAAAARRIRKRAALLPGLVGALCVFGPLWAGQVGLLYWGAGFAFGGTAIVLVMGR